MHPTVKSYLPSRALFFFNHNDIIITKALSNIPRSEVKNVPYWYICATFIAASVLQRAAICAVLDWKNRNPRISSGKDHRPLFLSLLLLQGPPFPVKSNMEVLSILLLPYSLKPVPEFLLNISVAFNVHEAWLFNLEQIWLIAGQTIF